MKLFTKYNRINLSFTIVIFIAGSIVYSLLIRYVVNKQTDNDLITERDEIVTYVKQYNSLPEIEDARGEYTTYKRNNTNLEQGMRFYTQKRWNPEEHDGEFVRTIAWSMHVGNSNYLVTISKSLDVTEDLIQSIIIITIALILLVLMAGLLVNRLLLKRLWKPFYQSMETIQQFKLNAVTKIHLDKSNIDEFNLMNTTLRDALDKARNDYHVLKEFTENASHELQTPLAVISSKLDVLIQSEDLTKPQSEAIGGAYSAIQQLKRLNQSLLLLAKIENRQFTEQTSIDLQQLVHEKQKQFAEQLQDKNIAVGLRIADSTIPGNKYLADIMLNNLFSNAIRHNHINGTLLIELHPRRLKISNSGKPKPLDESGIFSRFYKADPATVHHGLGLSIVKQICDVSGYHCGYEFQSPDVHSFIISW